METKKGKKKMMKVKKSSKKRTGVNIMIVRNLVCTGRAMEQCGNCTGSGCCNSFGQELVEGDHRSASE